MDTIMKFVPASIKNIPVHMDFEGQRKAERMFQVIITVFGMAGFIWGYICQLFSQTMYILLAGFALSCVLTLPPWPMFRKNSIQWQKPRKEPEEKAEASSPSTSQKSKKKK